MFNEGRDHVCFILLYIHIIYFWLCWVFPAPQSSLVAPSGDYSSLQWDGFSLWLLLLQSTGSVVVAHGLSCSKACGIFPDQGLNSCLLQWQVDSLPLSHQRSPVSYLIYTITSCLYTEVSWQGAWDNLSKYLMTRINQNRFRWEGPRVSRGDLSRESALSSKQRVEDEEPSPGGNWSKRLPERLKENPGKMLGRRMFQRGGSGQQPQISTAEHCREVKCPHGGSSGTTEKGFGGPERTAQVKNEWGKQVIKISRINIS